MKKKNFVEETRSYLTVIFVGGMGVIQPAQSAGKEKLKRGPRGTAMGLPGGRPLRWLAPAESAPAAGPRGTPAQGSFPFFLFLSNKKRYQLLCK